MGIVPETKKAEQKAIIRRVLTLTPHISVLELQRRLDAAETPLKLDYAYLTDLVNEIRIDRIQEVEEETKEELYAQISDLIEWVNQNLRAIAQEEKLVYMAHKDGKPTASPETRIFAQNNRIKALNSVVDNMLKLMNLKMDLGIIERKLGTADFKIIDMMSALKKIRNGDYTTPLENLIPITDGGNDTSGENKTITGTD